MSLTAPAQYATNHNRVLTLTDKNVVMAQITLILTISFTLAATRLDPVESRLNQLPPNVFQIRTSEAAAASIGNNQNVVTESLSKENFQAISTASSFDDKKSKKYGERNDKSHSNQANVKEISQAVKPQRLVWDNCLETDFRENQGNSFGAQDMEIADQDYRIDYSDYSKEVGEVKEIGPSWNKRDAGTAKKNQTASYNAWIEKYNNLMNSKAEERRAQKQEPVFIKKNAATTLETTSATTTLTSTAPELIMTRTSPSITEDSEISTVPLSTFPVILLTREVFKEQLVPNTTQNTLTDSYVIASYTEDWFDVKDRTKIRFSSLPQRETYLVPALKLEVGFYPFSFMSEFFYVIYPFDFPIGLIKDIVWGEFTFPYSFIQSIKVESTFLAVIILFTCIALVIPCYLLILGILALLSNSRCDDDMETGTLFPETEDTGCSDRALAVITLLVVLICCVLITGMAVSNEQAHTAASSTRNVMSCALADIAAWLSAAARELHHSLVPPMDLVLHAYKEDLKNVESLLGEPIQQSIASESGIDLVFDSLADIIAESEDISLKIASLREVSIRAGSLASSTSDRIKDLARQLDNLKMHCTAKDMPLCDTVNTNSLEMKMKFDLILREQQLLQLRTLGVENLTRAISYARKEFRRLPSAIFNQTIQVREDILHGIESRRQAVHSSVRVLSDIVRHLTTGLHTTSRRMDSALDRVQKYEFGRWTVMLTCIVILGFVMALILMALLCGCGHAKNHAQRTLKVSAGWLCFASLVLWGMISTIFLVTGHAEVYVCHALWDSPQFETLTALLDRPSPLLTNYEGVFDALFRDLENITIDVSIKDVLRDCEKDRPAYIVFQLDKILDVNKETSYFEWEELQADFGRLTEAVDVGLLKTISISFSKLLHQMLQVTDVQLAKYRMDYNVPVVGKDLPSLVDQLENVAAQVTDLTTAARLETLASRTQRLHTANIKPLEQIRADVVFKLTELELQLMPFRRKLNISLSHIHTAQFYIDNQGDVISRKKISMYISRLISHAAGWRTHVLTSVGKHAARCRPLFNVFFGARTLFCTSFISSLHGWWVCGFFLGLIWCSALMPLCVKLWRTYGRKIRAQEALCLATLGSGQQETPTTALCDGSNWNTPGPPAPPPRSDSW